MNDNYEDNDGIAPYDPTKVKVSKLLGEVLDELERFLKPYGHIDDIRMQLERYEDEIRECFHAAREDEER